jgi:hypothetical protein
MAALSRMKNEATALLPPHKSYLKADWVSLLKKHRTIIGDLFRERMDQLVKYRLIVLLHSACKI